LLPRTPAHLFLEKALTLSASCSIGFYQKLTKRTCVSGKRMDFYAATTIGAGGVDPRALEEFERFARIWKPSAWRQEKAGSTLGSNGAKRWSKETQKV
jgi:hypothetical protein